MDKNRKITINFNNYEPKISREEKNRITEKEFNKEKKNRKPIYNIDRNKTEYNNTRIRLERRRNNYKEKNFDYLDNNFGEEDNKNFKILQTMQNEIIDKFDNNKQLELSLNDYTLPRGTNEKNFYTSNNNDYNYQKEKNAYRNQTSKEKRKIANKNNKILDSEKKAILNKLIMNQRINNQRKKNANKPLNDLSASQNLYNEYKMNQMVYHSINNNIPNCFINNNINNKSLEYRRRKEREGSYKDKNEYIYYDKERSFNNGRNYDDNKDIKNTGEKKTIKNIKLKNLNFHKNNSSNSIYCSPKKQIYSMNHNKKNKENEQNENNDEKAFYNPKFERSYDNINRKNLILNNNDYIYKKCSRNHRNSCIINDNKIIGNEFNKNNRILNDNCLIGKTFNSPLQTYDKRNVISQTSSVKKDRRISTQNRSLSKNNKVIIPLNEFRNVDKSKYGTMENIDENEDENRPCRRNNKKYFYQLDNNNNNNSDNNKYFSINNNIYKNKTIERRTNGNKLYDDKDNSYEYNIENSVNSNDINYSKYRNKNKNPKNKEKIYIEDNRIQEEENDHMNQNKKLFKTLYDFGKKIKSRDNFGDNVNINNNNILNSNKKIKTRGVLANSVKKRQLVNSFDCEIDNENQNYKEKNNINGNIHKNSRNSLITQKGKFSDFNEYLNYRSKKNDFLNSKYNSKPIKKNASPIIYKTKSKINKIGKGSPLNPYYENDNDKEEVSYSLKKNENDYYNKTVEDYYKNKLECKPNSKFKSKNESAVGPTPRNSVIVYNKRNSQNNIPLNNSKNSNSIDTNIPDFNKTYYPKKSSNNSIYHKKNIKSKISDISSTTENKTIKKDQNDNLSMNSSHNSNNNKNSNLNNNKNISNKCTDNMSSSNNENDEIIIPRNESSFSINKPIFIETHCFYKKYYQYNIKKPINKIYYMKKDIKINKKNKNNKKKENEENVNNLNNISIASENKNDFNSSNISFSNNKTKKKPKNIKETQTEKILLNGKNIVYDYDSKDNSEFNFEYETPNNKNKDNGNNFKNEKNNNGIKLNFSEEKNEDKILINNDKDEKELLKKNIIKYIPVKEETSEYKDYLLSADRIINSDIGQIKNEINDKNISLATKKLNDLLMKKNDRHFTYNQEKKKKKFRRSLTEEKFILGYSKLNDIFDKKYSNKKLKDRTNNINVICNKFNNNINDKIEEEEINDIDNDDFEMNKKAFTYKVNKKNKLFENLENLNEKDTKTYKLEKILSLKNKDLSLKDNLLNNEVKSHINDLIEPEYKVGKLNTNTLKTNNLIKLYKKIDNKNNSKEKEKGIEDKIIDLLDILNKENLIFISEQLINIIYYDNTDNDSNKQNDKIISKKYIDNINHFVNIIYQILLNEDKDMNLYSQLCNKINYLLLKENNYKDENNLENIIIKEYLKIVTNQEFINSINNEEFENVKNKFIDLSNFIIELTSFKLIEIKKSLNIIFQLFKEYEKEYKNNNVKFLFLEICAYIFESVLEIILEFPKIEDNINNLIDDVLNKLNKCLQEKKLPSYLKDKIINIREKRKQKLNKEDKQDKRIINKRISGDFNKIEEIINNNRNKKDKKEENKVNNNKIYKYEKRIDNLKDNIEEQEIKINENDDSNNNIEKKEIENSEDLISSIKFDKISNNFNNKYNTFIPNKSNYDTISEIDINKNDVSAEIKKNYNVTHKKKSKSRKKSRSIEKRPLSISKPINFKEELNEEDKKIKQDIKDDFENYVSFLERKRIRRKEDIYNELNNSFNWNVIDDLISIKNVRLEEIIKFFIEICKEKKIPNDDIFKANEYIKTIIEYYLNDLSKNQKDIFHLNMIEIYMAIDDLVENDNEDCTYMHEIMGNLLYILLKNKLYFMKDLNNFFGKSKETQINIAKVVKYTIIASRNSAKKYHNDFKYTKLFNNNDIFNLYVTNKLNELKII